MTNLWREFAGSQIGKILRRKRLQGEPRFAGQNRQPALLGSVFDDELGSLRKLADDVVDEMGRRGRRALARHLGGDFLDHLDIEIGRGETQARPPRLQQDIGQYGYGVAPLDDALHMIERPQQGRALDRYPHCPARLLADRRPGACLARAHALWRFHPRVVARGLVLAGKCAQAPRHLTNGGEDFGVNLQPRQDLRRGVYCCSMSLISSATSPARRVVGDHQFLDLAHGMKNRRMIPPAEAPADFGQRSGGELLGEIHAHLARPHDRTGAARRQYIGARYIVVAADELEDVFDAHARRYRSAGRDRAAPSPQDRSSCGRG